MRPLIRLVLVGVLLPLAVAGCSSSGSPARGDGGRTCQQLLADYNAAVSAASACTPGAPNQCQAAVSVSICAGCNRYVTDATAVEAASAQFFGQKCHQSGPTACTFTSCIQIGPWGCVATDSGSAGGFCTVVPRTD
jgi:hypothetical protein